MIGCGKSKSEVEGKTCKGELTVALKKVQQMQRSATARINSQALQRSLLTDALEAQTGQLSSAIALPIVEACDEHVRTAHDAAVQAQRAALFR